jgi:hypothetical protein
LGEDALYFPARCGDKPLMMALDWSQEPKLYVDSNLDGDLADEKPLKGKTGETGRPQFGLCRVKTDAGEMKFWAVATSKNQLVLCPTGFMSGQVQLDGQPHAVALMDSNFDARYNVPILLPIGLPMKETWDTIALDANGDGQFQSYDEVWPITKMTKVKDAFFEVEIRADGSKIALKAATPPMGGLDVEFPDAEVELWSDACCQAVGGSGGKWQLPAGRYRANTWAVHCRDAEGNRWTLKSGSTGGKLNDFTIPIGGTASFSLGPPLALLTSSRREGATVTLQLLLVGQSEEAYVPVVEKDDKPMTPPKMKILDESGKVLASGECVCDEYNNYCLLA